jgi:hypothetical protein
MPRVQPTNEASAIATTASPSKDAASSKRRNLEGSESVTETFRSGVVIRLYHGWGRRASGRILVLHYNGHEFGVAAWQRTWGSNSGDEMIPSTHNIRRPAFWLVLTCLGAIGFFLLTDPRAGYIKYPTDNVIDAVWQARVGTIVGLGGAGLLLLIGLFLCTRRGSPPRGDASAAKG